MSQYIMHTLNTPRAASQIISSAAKIQSARHFNISSYTQIEYALIACREVHFTEYRKYIYIFLISYIYVFEKLFRWTSFPDDNELIKLALFLNIIYKY